MGDSDGDSKSIPWQQLLILGLVIIAGSHFFAPNLSSDRPQGEAVGSDVMGLQTIDARLWQDPFATVDSHNAATEYEKESQSLGKLRDACFMNGNTPLPEDQTPLIIAVMINGGPYAEKVEQRIRTRVAVGSGLAVAQYRPLDEEHLGAFTIPWPRSPEDYVKYPEAHGSPTTDDEYRDSLWLRNRGENWDAHDKDLSWLTVPWEIYEPDSTNLNRKVLVLWLKDELFTDNMLERLGGLWSWFTLAGKNKPAANIVVIGPDSSSSLHSLLLRLGDISQSPFNRSLLQTTTILSDRATATTPILLEGSLKNTTAVSTLSQYIISHPNTAPALLADIPNIPTGGIKQFIDDFKNQPIKEDTVNHLIENVVNADAPTTPERFRFFRTIPTDDALLQTAIKELSRRHIVIKAARDLDHRANVALVSEWDSFYGQALPHTFITETVGTGIPSSDYNPEDRPKNIHLYTYLRGIDGKIPQDQSKSADKDSSKSASNPTDLTDLLQSLKDRQPKAAPEGTNQSDTVLRIATKLRGFSQTLPKDQPLAAVGVLGSDVYDKLMVLHALHDELPSTLFFTTNFDARYSYPDELEATRNLIVVSAFGLSLSPTYQRDIPPFRDSYQTSAFAATLMATKFIPTMNLVDLPPRIYEIGKDQAFDLSTNEPSGHAAPAQFKSFYPSRNNFSDFGKIREWEGIICSGSFIVIYLLSAIAVVAFLIYTQCQQLPKAITGFQRFLLGVNSTSALASMQVGASLVAALPVIIWILSYYYFSQGLDGEPFALFSGVSMWPTEFLRCITILLGLLLLRRTFVLWNKQKEEISRHFHLDESATQSDDSSRPCPVKVWRKYTSNVPLFTILSGLLIGIGMLWILQLILKNYFGLPIIPGRGETIFNLDRWVTHLVFYTSIYLTLTTAIIIFFNARLIDPLKSAPTLWPNSVISKYRISEKITHDAIAWYVDVKFIGRNTDLIGSFIYYPFIIIALLIISRMSCFDRWDWPVSLIVMQGLNALIASILVIYLSLVAESIRRKAQHEIQKCIYMLRSENKFEAVEQTQKLLDEVDNYDLGIFAPLLKQPLFCALLLPSGSAGLLALIQSMQ